MSDEDRRRDKFRNFVDALAARPNSQLITDEKAERIRRVVKGGDDTARFRFYVRSKGFSNIDLPSLGLTDVLCVPASKVSYIFIY